MKQFCYLLISFLLLSPALPAQNSLLQGFIAQHKDDPAFTHAFLSKDLFEIATKSSLKNEDWNGLHHAIKNIGSLSILAADSISNAVPIYKEVRTLIPEDEYDEILTVRDGNENVRGWIRSKDDMVTDLILLIGTNDEFVLVCFSGNLELGNITELAGLFETGKAQHLAKKAEAVSIDFSIHPNPGNGVFNLIYTDEEDPPAMLIVLDQSGRTLTTLNLSGTERQTIALQNLASGLYWLQLNTKKGRVGIKQLQIVQN